MKRIFPGQAMPRSEVRRLSLEAFRSAIIAAPTEGRRVSSMFGLPVSGASGASGAVDLFAVIADDDDGGLLVGSTLPSGDSFPSMTLECPEVHLFEREIAEQWGLVPTGHPWLKPVRFHRSNRAGYDAWALPEGAAPMVGITDFYRVEGDEIHEVAVGPVHAGVIEPGHFRFQCHGEQVFHLEISLGYQHRGIERALIGGPNKRSLHLLETAAGDTTIGHATAYCQLLETLSGTPVTARAHAIRAIALELERLANHTGGLGGLATDIGFLPTASYCGRLRGDWLNLSALLCGNRFGRSLLRPGGVGFDLDAAMIEQAIARIKAAAKDVEGAVSLLWSTASVQARLEETGKVSLEHARDLGLVGVAARASGLDRDVRRDHPSGIFRFAQIPVSTSHSGDVFGRAFVRWLEIQRSIAFILELLENLPGGSAKPSAPIEGLPPDRLAVALVEGWRGELCHVALTDGEGRLASYKVVDPSFHNWSGLAMALRNQQISDFPLCNKSFDLSYCGYDL